MSTAKRSKVCASPSLQGENIPLGSIQEGTPPGSEGEKSAPVSSPLVSRPTSPRKSIDRPGTPIPREGATSPNLSLRSGRSGQFFHRVPLVPVNDAVPSPVQELVEDGQVPTETQPVPAVKTYQGQEPFVAVTPISRSSHLLPSDKLETEPNPRDTTPHVMVQGWLKEVGSSPRRESIDVPVNALSQHGDSTAKATNNHKISNSTLNPPAPSTLPENGTDITPTAVDKDELTLDTAKGQEGVKQAGKPTTLSAIGTTITDAIKSLIPAAASSVTNFPVHNVPLPRRAAPADDRQDQTSRAVDTNDAIPKMVREVDVAEVTDTVGQPATDTGTISAKTITEIFKPDAPKQKEPVSEITVSNATTPAIPPRPQGSRLSVGRPATTAAVPEPAREPPTPAPPGRYPPTPAAVGEDPLSDPSAADKGPFVSFRAKQLLGHFLARDAPPRPSADRVTARPSRGARRDSLGHDDRVWGTRGLGSNGSGRGSRRGVQGTE
ncbi:hypothetical protein BR93DRAFT_936116 [Coniochaeta sp. PMI_546]|nr:hypothetical protein BR93DRAFT_936116 [Coniochaeta sp. PMI_546]